MITDLQISVFKSAKSTEGVTSRLITFLKSTKWKENILSIRSLQDKNQRNNLKKTLPAATISGVFKKRAADQISLYNGLVCLDFDEGDNPGKTPDEMKACLREFDEVLYAGLSVGGKGVFAIIATNNDDPTRHPEVVAILGQAMSQYDLYIDQACKDVSRLRFVSYDPDAYWNQTPAFFDAKMLLKKMQHVQRDIRKPRPLIVRQAHTHSTDKTMAKVEALVSKIEAQRVDMTDNYDDWIRAGFSLANEFGAAGEGFFLRISQFNSKFNHQEAEKKYAEFVRNGRRIKIGTFFKICQDNGITL